MSKDNEKNNNSAEGNSSAEEKIETKVDQDIESETTSKDNEWLEEEINEVDANTSDNEEENDSAEELMKKAADQLEKFKAEVKEWKDNYMRLHAEWDTYRRRTKEQSEQQKAEATQNLVKDVLPVIDDFERSIDYAKNNGEDGLLSGVEAVYTKLVDALVKNGVEVLNPIDDAPFDALQHQAVATVENTEVFDETVANVMQKGYKMGKKVIRPAMVSVTTGGPQRPKPEEEENEEK